MTSLEMLLCVMSESLLQHPEVCSRTIDSRRISALFGHTQTVVFSCRSPSNSIVFYCIWSNFVLSHLLLLTMIYSTLCASVSRFVIDSCNCKMLS